MDIKYWITIVSIVLGVYLINFGLRKLIGFAIKRQSVVINADPTNFSFIKNSMSFIFYTIGLIAIFYITPTLSAASKALFAGAGILAAVLGFASQKAFSNIISGVFILIFKPFCVNDTIEIGADCKGVVEEITLRHTIIRNYEQRRIIIPNSKISDETIINSSIIDSRIKKFVEFDISYDSDIDLAKKIIQEEALKHPFLVSENEEEDLKGKPEKVLLRVVNLGDYSVKIRAYLWALNNDNAWIMYCDLIESVKKRFDKEGIEIPFPYRTLVFKNGIKESVSEVIAKP